MRFPELAFAAGATGAQHEARFLQANACIIINAAAMATIHCDAAVSQNINTKMTIPKIISLTLQLHILHLLLFSRIMG